MEKKPFNPVIGEIHTCWIDHGDGNWSEFLAEQVSHHPPLSAFFVRNKKENIRLHSNLEFSVHFGGNNATVQTAGPVVLHTAFEDYTMDKMTPNMIIQRVIYGVKYFMWEGPISLECKKTGYTAQIELCEEDENTNRLTGKISHVDKGVIYLMNGITGSTTNIWHPNTEKEKRELTNGKAKPVMIHYPPPDCRVHMDSLELWKPVSLAIIDADMWAADQAKKEIEQDQRIREKRREAAGADYDAQFFKAEKDDSGKIVKWIFNEELSVDSAFLEKLKSQASDERDAKKKKKDEAAAMAQENAALNAPEAPPDETCILS